MCMTDPVDRPWQVRLANSGQVHAFLDNLRGYRCEFSCAGTVLCCKLMIVHAWRFRQRQC